MHVRSSGVNGVFDQCHRPRKKWKGQSTSCTERAADAESNMAVVVERLGVCLLQLGGPGFELFD